MKILADQWCALQLRNDPYPWVLVRPGELIAPDDALRLAASFPVDGMVRLDRGSRTHGKRYRNYSLPIGEENAAALPPVWRQLIADLRSQRYRENMAALLGQPVAARQEIRLVRHGPDDWLEPHTDSAEKLFTQVFYFNPGWRESDGGWLEILDSADPGSARSRVLPELGASVIIRRSERSWHRVAKVSPEAQAHRQSLIVHGEQ